MRTYSAKASEVQRKWYLVDLEGKTLGRAASEIAKVLSGKNKPIYTPHVDTGDFVVVVNANKLKVTGSKLRDKKYYHHSGYPGGIKEISLQKLLQKHPTEAIKHAVKGMLPKNRLARQMIKKLKIYAEPVHPHDAQNPEPMEV